MIVLCHCSTSYCQNDTIPPTGGLEDSVLISYNDLRIVNGKLIELKYEKEINSRLKDIIRNDSVAIALGSSINAGLNNKYNRDTKKLRRQRNGIAIGGIGAVILLILSMFK